MLVNVADIIETWTIVRYYEILPKINDLPYLFSEDLKLTLILLVSFDQLRGIRELLDSLKRYDNYEHDKTFDDNDEIESNFSSLPSMMTSDEVLNTIQNE